MMRRTFLWLSARAGLAARRRESSRRNIQLAHKAASWAAQLGLTAGSYSWVWQLRLTAEAHNWGSQLGLTAVSGS